MNLLIRSISDPTVTGIARSAIIQPPRKLATGELRSHHLWVMTHLAPSGADGQERRSPLNLRVMLELHRTHQRNELEQFPKGGIVVK